MTSRLSGDKPLLLLGLGLLTVAAALPSAVLHLGDSPRSDGTTRPTLFLAAPCPHDLNLTDAQADALHL